MVRVPERPGLGLEPDLDRIEAANALYREHGLGRARRCGRHAVLDPGWAFDAKKPCLVR